MSGKALIIGNSDGIGLAATIELRKRGWTVVGVSRSDSVIKDSAYEHIVVDVQDEEFVSRLKSILEKESLDLCIFCAGIGELLDVSNMDSEVGIFNTCLSVSIKNRFDTRHRGS